MQPGPHYPALIGLLKAADTLWNSSRLFFARWDLSPSQFNILNLLGDDPGGLTQMQLSRELIMHRSNATGLIDRLEKRGLVQRAEVPGDRRANRILLTPAGRKLLKQILPDYYEAAEKIWGDISPTRARQMVIELEQVTRMARTLTSAS